jgi:uncharacterized delta-60 repeat protein
MEAFVKRLLFTGLLAGMLTACPQPPSPTPSFDLTLNPDTLTLKQASSGTVTVSIGNPVALTEPITLSLVNAPKGLNATFQPASLSSGSSQLKLTPDTLEPGTLDVKVRGSSGAVTREATLKLTVTSTTPPPPPPPPPPSPPSNFIVKLDKTAIDIEQDDEASFNATVERLDGFTGLVGFEVSGLPTGVRLISGQSANGTDARIVLRAEPDAPLTNAPAIVTITGKSGDIARTATLELSVVTKTDDFELEPINPIRLHRNLSNTLEIKVVRDALFSGEILVSFGGLPSGVTIPQGDIVIPGNESSVFVTVSAPNGAIQPTPINVIASSQGIIRTTTFQLEVIDPLDGTFGAQGVSTQDVFALDELRALVVLPNGNIVTSGVGSANQAMLAQFNATGGFVAGRLFTNVNEINALLLDSNNQLVGAGLSKIGAGNSNFALTKSLLNSINPDNTFDNDGQTAVDFGSSENANAITRDKGGKYIVAGIGARATGNFDFAVARFNPNGTLDTTFSPGTNDGDSDAAGVALVDFGSSGDRFDRALEVAVQPDGKIVVVGFTSDNVDANLKPEVTQPAKTLTAIARFNPDGSLDTSFDTDGKITLGFDETNENKDQLGLRVRFQAIAGVVSSITVVSTRFKERLIVHTKLEANGNEVVSRNESFGVVGLDTEEINTVLFTDNDEKYYAIGSGRASGSLNGVFVTRFVARDTNFEKDSSFGINGTQAFVLPGTSLNARAAILQNDQILIGGFIEKNGARDALLLRFLR